MIWHSKHAFQAVFNGEHSTDNQIHRVVRFEYFEIHKEYNDLGGKKRR